jgi:hypothetical protein
MNNYFNFIIPEFNQRYGVDWEDFTEIIDYEVDNVMNKTYQLYWLREVDKMPLLALELSMKLRGITVFSDETIQQKRLRVRSFNTDFKRKATEDIYLDYAEEIFGERGDTYPGYLISNRVWGTSHWPIPSSPDSDDMIWSGLSSHFTVYVMPKPSGTASDADLDELVATYQEPFLLPAFYKIFLIDNNYQIVRSV